MTFTYDPADDNGKIRLNIGDTVENTGIRPDSRNFSDEELAVFLAEETIVGRATARALEVAANEFSTLAMNKDKEEASDYRGVGDSLAKRAKTWRSMYGNTPIATGTATAAKNGSYRAIPAPIMAKR